MPAKSLEAHVRQQPRVAIIDVEREIELSAEDALNAAYAEAESRDSHVIVLNFSKVDYINSAGIALIVGLLARARKSTRRLLACGLSDHYVEIFQITPLVDFISGFPDETSALADCSKPLSLPGETSTATRNLAHFESRQTPYTLHYCPSALSPSI